MDAATVFLENERWLWTVVYSRLGDRTATEDVLQEVSLAAIVSEKKNQSIREARGWLYQVAIRQVLLFRRKEARYRRRISGLADRTVSSDDFDSLDYLCACEDVQQVRDGLSELRESDRQILVLKYNDELSCRQIADRLGVQESTVQSRLLRARRRLRGILQCKVLPPETARLVCNQSENQ
ncbi:MAG TPA: RNA polymerase subunit sigma-24 [Planctomycetaceae bacterium]|nr:RNA polymerase subunit sigma-24 [Planctomycetaceae bacterium]